MKSILKFVVLVLLLVIIALYSSSYFITLNDKKDSIVKTFKNSTGLSVKIAGDINFKLLPFSELIINQASIDIENNKRIEVDKLILTTSYMSIFSDNILIKAISVENSKINLEELQALKNVFLGARKNDQLKLNEVNLVNLDLIINPEANFLGKISAINGKVKFTLDKSQELSLKGSFSVNDINYQVNGYFDSDPDVTSYLNLSNEFLDFKFSGNLANKGGYDLNGKSILKLQVPVKKNEYDPIFLALLQEQVELKSDLRVDNGQMRLDNISIGSNNINKALGAMGIAFGYDNEIDFNFSIDQIDLDKFVENVEINNKAILDKFTLEKFIKNFLEIFNVDLPGNIDGDIGFNIKHILFNKKEISDLKFEISVFEGKFMISHASAVLPGNTKVTLAGGLTHNYVRSKFQGNIAIQSTKLKELLNWFNTESVFDEKSNFQKFIIQSDVSIIPRNLNLFNTKISWGDVRLIGKSYIRNTGDKKLVTKISARIDYLDANNINLPPAIDDLIYKMYAYDSDKFGSKFLEAINDFKWLRVFPVDFIGEFLVDKVKYKNVILGNVYSNFRISNNNLNIDRFDFNTSNAEGEGSLILQVSGLTPKINFNLHFKRLNDLFLPEIVPNFDQLDKMFLKVNTQKDIASGDKIKSEPADITIPGFNFFSLDKFIGDITLKIDSYTSKNLNFQNFNLNALLSDGVVSIPKLTANIFSGQAEIIGNVVLLTQIPGFNFSFAINSFNPAELLKLYSGYDQISGYMSLSGSLTTSGINLYSAVSRTNGNFKIIGKQIAWKGFDIGEMIKLSEVQLTLADKIDKIKYFSDNGISIFEEVDGVIEIVNGLVTLKDCNFSNNRTKGIYVAKLDLWNRLISGAGKISFIPYGTTSPIVLIINNTGNLANQTFQLDSNQLIKYLNYKARLTDTNTSKPEDANAQSLLRNRRL